MRAAEFLFIRKIKGFIRMKDDMVKMVKEDEKSKRKEDEMMIKD